MSRYLASLIAVYVLIAGLVLVGSPLAAVRTTPNAPPSGPTPAQPAQPATQPNAQQARPQQAAPPQAQAEPTATAPTPPVAVAAGPGSVSIVDYSFSPGSITVSAGDTVTWTNSGKQPHSATGSGFDTGILKTGQSGSHTFSSAGTFSYLCSVHPFMKGTVVVRAASSGGGSSGGGSNSGATGSSGGGSSAGSSQAGNSSEAAAENSTGSGLPPTGADAAVLGGLGLLLLGLGFALRRRAGLTGDGR